jgi:hyperosmotically inducible periplasmic protein
MRTKMIAVAFAAVLAVGVTGCASDSHRGVEDTGAIASDSWITTKVKSDLAVEKDVSATHIQVDTYEGVVTLSGTAASQAEADKAVSVARDIKGVKSVVNNIQIKS